MMSSQGASMEHNPTTACLVRMHQSSLRIYTLETYVLCNLLTLLHTPMPCCDPLIVDPFVVDLLILDLCCWDPCCIHFTRYSLAVNPLLQVLGRTDSADL